MKLSFSLKDFIKIMKAMMIITICGCACTYHPTSVQLVDVVTLDSSNFHTPSHDDRQLKSKSNAGANTVAVAKLSNLFEKLLKLPSPPPKLPTLKEKGSSQVLTSVEALKLLDEKEKKKEAAQQKKLEQQKKRL